MFELKSHIYTQSVVVSTTGNHMGKMSVSQQVEAPAGYRVEFSCMCVALFTLKFALKLEWLLVIVNKIQQVDQ